MRTRIGLAGQATTVDDLLTARANLEMIGRLYHLPRREARRRGDELLERLGLTEAADRLVRTYSGGMRRRLDLAAGLVAAPPVLFMDEPTTGLDPQARNELWAVLRELVSDGASLVLTTQYLEEADRLADSIVVLDQGRVVAEGTPAELKQQVGGERVEVTVARPADVARALRRSPRSATRRRWPTSTGRLVTVPVRAGARLIEIVRALDGAGVDATDIHRREATLDDAFLALTDRPAERAA